MNIIYDLLSPIFIRSRLAPDIIKIMMDELSHYLINKFKHITGKEFYMRIIERIIENHETNAGYYALVTPSYRTVTRYFRKFIYIQRKIQFSINRKVGPQGISILGINYSSKELRKYMGKEIQVAVDRLELSKVDCIDLETRYHFPAQANLQNLTPEAEDQLNGTSLKREIDSMIMEMTLTGKRIKKQKKLREEMIEKYIKNSEKNILHPQIPDPNMVSEEQAHAFLNEEDLEKIIENFVKFYNSSNGESLSE